MSDYAQYSDAELIAAMETAGRYPQPDLIEEILGRRATLASSLTALFSESVHDAWDNDDDPRWYRFAHAGRILLHWREQAALPTFAALYQDAGDELEWFEVKVASFGPPAVPYFRDVLLADTGTDWHYGKSMLAEALAQIALQYPETRTDVLSTLHAVLPSLREDGTVDYPADQAPDENWIGAVFALAELQDESSRDVALALFASDMLDEMIGTRDLYLRELKQPGKPAPNIVQYDFLAEAKIAWEFEQTRLNRIAREAARPQGRPASPPTDRTKVGRNDPCPCGSGKKYKHCCGKK